MKVFSIALILSAAFVEQTLAHYRFFKFINSGNVGGEYVDIRKNTNYNSPVTDPTSLDMRCNVGGQASAATTETLSVTAGSTIGFRADGAATHPGPFNIYMAKAPKTASQYDGSGAEWFRVWEKGATFSSGAITFDTSSIDHTFVLPKCLPNGDYLVRIEHIALHTASTYGGAQYYISCAQITVTNGGSTTPTNKVAIPGVYTGYEPSIMINIYYPVPTSYTVPGPPIFKC